MRTWQKAVPLLRAEHGICDLLDKIAALRRNETIFPPQDQILSALALTPFNRVKAVILGQDPYHGAGQAHGLAFSGVSPDRSLVEIVELPDHPWFVAVQFHPEFKSKPTAAHPLFAGFIRAAVERRGRQARGAALQPDAI